MMDLPRPGSGGPIAQAMPPPHNNDAANKKYQIQVTNCLNVLIFVVMMRLI